MIGAPDRDPRTGLPGLGISIICLCYLFCSKLSIPRAINIVAGAGRESSCVDDTVPPAHRQSARSGKYVIRLYYYPSYVSLFPHILLEEIGLEYELVFVDRYANAHKRPEYLELNPNGLIPVLSDGDLVLYEAAAISLHLVDCNPSAELAPPLGTSERAHFYKWMAWLATHLHPALSMYLHPNKWAQDPNSSAALRSNAERRVGDLLDIIDAELEKHRGSWLLGSTYSALDAYALTLCRWSRRMPRPAVGWPHFGAYARRVFERPAVRRAFQQEHLAEPWI